MKGRILVWPLLVVLALALAGQTVRWRARIQAGRLLARVETLTMVAARQGKAPRGPAALEPRPEIYLNLGRAEWLGHHPEEAKRDFATAIRLDPRLVAVVPPEMR